MYVVWFTSAKICGDVMGMFLSYAYVIKPHLLSGTDLLLPLRRQQENITLKLKYIFTFMQIKPLFCQKVFKKKTFTVA